MINRNILFKAAAQQKANTFMVALGHPDMSKSITVYPPKVLLHMNIKGQQTSNHFYQPSKSINSILTV